MITIDEHESSHLRHKLCELEGLLVRYMVENPDWLAPKEEATLRWALSLARLTKVRLSNKFNTVIDLANFSDQYRANLWSSIASAFNRLKLNPKVIEQQLRGIKALAKKERNDLVAVFGPALTLADLDKATRVRPLALVLGGGGGTGYVFVGAFHALEEAGMTPSIIAGTSMGAILGAYRARVEKFSFDGIDNMVAKTSWTKIAQPFSGASRFGVPATFRLYLRDTIGHQFEEDGEFLRLKDMKIPFRVCVAGLCGPGLAGDKDLEKYAHLLDPQATAAQIRVKNRSVINQILDFAHRPLKAIYLGNDELTSEFDVLDAVGFSAAIPGVLHYDIFRDDPRMVSLVQTLLDREGVARLLDGGFVDNMPAKAALDAVDMGACEGFDPFVLALDSFSPTLSRNWLFYPLMRFAMENSREGHALSHLSIRFKGVLSPVHFVPTVESFHQAVQNGHGEITPHLRYIRKMIGPIPDPSW
jgi:predicted acylesterase/phospholipase RssA